MFERHRLSQLLMKQMLVFHSPQSDLPQVASPWVPSASSRPSAVKDGHPSQRSLFSVVLQKQSWTYAIVYKRSSLSRAFPACCLALRKCVWILQGVFPGDSFSEPVNYIFDWLWETVTKVVAVREDAHIYLEFSQNQKLWNPNWKPVHPPSSHSAISVLIFFFSWRMKDELFLSCGKPIWG